MEIHHLRYFVAVAEAGGFARAAARLHVAQPALSRQVRDLEEELNVPLFDRTTRGVQLTYPGELFLEDVRRMLADLQRSQIRARDAHNGKIGSFTLGLLEAFSWHKAITHSIHTFRKQNPDVSLNVVIMSSPEQIAALHERRISAGFLITRPPADKLLEGVKVLTDHLMVAVPQRSRFARKPPEQLSELAGEDFFWFPRSVNPVYYDEVVCMCRKNGFLPRLMQGGTTSTANLSLVAAGLGCTFVASEVRWHKPKNVAIIPVRDLSFSITLELVWHRENRQQALRNFVQIFTAKG
jgi:DNA-binding transcriptional LysR family regulator